MSSFSTSAVSLIGARVFAAVFAALLFFQVTHAAADAEAVQPPWEMWQEAYREYEKAENLALERKYGEALESFVAAEKLFESIRFSAPQWNSSLVQQRLELCQRRIASLRLRLDQATPAAPVAPATPEEVVEAGGDDKPVERELPLPPKQVDFGSMSVSERVATMERQLAEYHQKYQELSENIDELRVQAERGNRAVEQLRTLAVDREDLQRKYADVLLELNQLRGNARELEEAREWRGRFEDERESGEALRREIREILSNNTLLERDREAAVRRAMETEKNLRVSNEMLEQLRGKVGELRDTVVAGVVPAGIDSNLLAELRGRERELADKLAAQEKLNRDLNERLHVLLAVDGDGGESEGLLRQIAERDATLARLRAVLEETERQKDDMSKEVYLFKSKFAQLDIQARSQARDLEQIQNTNVQLRSEVEKLAAQHNEAANNIKAAAGDADTRLRELSTANAEFKAALEAERGQSAESKDALAKLETANAELQAALEAERGRVAATVAPPAQQEEMGNLRQRIERLSEALALAKERIDKGDSSRKILEVELIEKRQAISGLQGKLKAAAKPKSAAVAASSDVNRMSGDQFDEAIKSRVDRDVVGFLIRTAELAREEGDTDALVWHYEKALSIAPDHVEALKVLGDVYLAKGEDAKALSQFERAARLSPDDADLLVLLGRLHLENQNPRLAMGPLNRAVLLAPENPEVRLLLGKACEILGWRSAADGELRAALAVDPQSPRALRAMLMFLLGDPGSHGEAREMYAKYQQAGGDPDPEIEKLLE